MFGQYWKFRSLQNHYNISNLIKKLEFKNSFFFQKSASEQIAFQIIIFKNLPNYINKIIN